MWKLILTPLQKQVAGSLHIEKGWGQKPHMMSGKCMTADFDLPFHGMSGSCQESSLLEIGYNATLHMAMLKASLENRPGKTWV